MKKIFLFLVFFATFSTVRSNQPVPVWDRFELELESQVSYDNPLYDLRDFYAEFLAPSGKKHKINGFWDGASTWKIRFMPDEVGEWEYTTSCSDTTNRGLNRKFGSFDCIAASSSFDLYSKGRITRTMGSYHLNYADGTPFFWTACTAWNGGLKSTEAEWEHYLKQRRELGYNVIQLVATQWRGCDQNSQGDVAFEGHGRIAINPEFFQHFDQKMNRINAHGHLAGLVMLWALPFGPGRELSPGYYLADQEAILLGRYLVARYGAHHVAWILGGDGQFYGELEDRWLHIGREVFHDKPQGISTLHPHGNSWVGEIYGDEPWFDMDGYQSSHGTGKGTVRFINSTIAEGWKGQTPKPVINLEPCYEQIRNEIFEDDVRNACYWSVFAAPPAGITYGADGIWPWIRQGEKPLNHRYTPEVDSWEKGIELPGSKQIAYLGKFMQDFSWWELLPAQNLLLEQPGTDNYKQHISVLGSQDLDLILVYFPQKDLGANIHLPFDHSYSAEWFDPVNNNYIVAEKDSKNRVLLIKNPLETDAVLILSEKE